MLNMEKTALILNIITALILMCLPATSVGQCRPTENWLKRYYDFVLTPDLNPKISDDERDIVERAYLNCLGRKPECEVMIKAQVGGYRAVGKNTFLRNICNSDEGKSRGCEFENGSRCRLKK